MSIDNPQPPPRPPDPPPPPDRLQDPIAHELTPMEKWETGEDLRMAQDIIANRQQVDILRQQGNYEGAQQIEDFIAKLPTSDAIKANPEAYLNSLDSPGSTPQTPMEQTPMEKWEAGEDLRMAQDIVGNRQEAEILRQQGNYEGAQQIEDFIAKLPTSDAIKDNPQAYLDSRAVSPSYEPMDRAREPGDRVTIANSADDLPPEIRDRLDENAIGGMRWPVEVHDRVMAGGESFEKFSHYDWNDAGSTAEREAGPVAENPSRPMTWMREPEAGREEVFFDVIQDIRGTPLAQQMTDAEIGQLGRDFGPSDPHEGLALSREFDGGLDRDEARNARYTLAFEEGAHVTYLKSVVAPQDSPLENRVADAELPGGDEQIYLLDHDADRSTLTVSPVGGRVQFNPDGSMRWGYRDRPLH